eukprot:14461060-Ditylum_brightwellii.AAC.1
MSWQGMENPDPKKEWNKDMIKKLSTIPKNNEVLLVGDMNGTMDDEDIANLLAKTGLYDLLATKHGSSTPLTYVQGRNIIEF